MLLNTPIRISKNAPGPHVLDQLAAYLDYELPEDQRAVVREHLRRCPQCENELATLRATKQLLRDLPDLAPPRSFRLSPEQVAAANKQSVATALPLGRARLPRLVLALRGSAACVFVLLLLLVGTDLTSRPGAMAPVTASYLPPAAAGVPAESQDQQAQLRALPAAAPTSTTAAAAAQATDTAAPAAASAAQPNPQPTMAAAALAPEATPAAGGARSSAGGAPLNTEAAGTLVPAMGGPSADQASTAVAAAPPPVPAAKTAPTEGTFSAQSSPVNPLSGLSTPANPPLLQWLPWEVALGLLALVLAGASIFAARNR
jgi:anti-sigma factor RsiW